MGKFVGMLVKLLQKIFLPCLVSILYLLLILPVWGQSPTPTIEILTTKQPLLIGDTIRLRITVPQTSKAEYNLPLDKQKLAPFEIQGQPLIKTTPKGETQFELEVIPFKTGQIQIPSLTLVGSDGTQLRTPPVNISIEMISGDSKQIKEIQLIPTAPKNGWLQPVIIWLLILAALLLVFFRVVDRQLRRWFTPLPLPLPASDNTVVIEEINLEEQALARLKRLLASGKAQTDLKDFCVELANIMTDYAKARYGVTEQEYTSLELQRLFQYQGVPILIKSAYEQILELCDQVKFAGWPITPDVAEHRLHQAVDLLNNLNKLNYKNSLTEGSKEQL